MLLLALTFGVAAVIIEIKNFSFYVTDIKVRVFVLPAYALLVLLLLYSHTAVLFPSKLCTGSYSQERYKKYEQLL